MVSGSSAGMSSRAIRLTLLSSWLSRAQLGAEAWLHKSMQGSMEGCLEAPTLKARELAIPIPQPVSVNSDSSDSEHQ